MPSVSRRGYISGQEIILIIAKQHGYIGKNIHTKLLVLLIVTFHKLDKKCLGRKFLVQKVNKK